MSKEPTRPTACGIKPPAPPAPPRKRRPAFERVTKADLDRVALEADFQNDVVKLARLAGWRVYWTHSSKNSPAGWPDLVLTLRVKPGRPGKALFRELKRDRQPHRVSPEQRECLELLTAAGLDAKVWTPDDWPEIEQVLTAHRRRKRRP